MSTKESLSTQFARGSKECAKTHILIHSGERDWPDWPSFELELDPYFRPSKNHQMDRVRLAPSLLQIPHRFSSGERLQLGNIDICGASLSIQPPPPTHQEHSGRPPNFCITPLSHPATRPHQVRLLSLWPSQNRPTAPDCRGGTGGSRRSKA